MKPETIKNLNTIRELTRKSIVSQYRNSYLGIIWSVLNPLFTMLIMYLIFYNLWGRDDPYFIIYLLTGNNIFYLMKGATNAAMFSIERNKGLIKRIKIKEELFPLSATISNFINSFFSIIALFIVITFLQLFGGMDIFNFQMFYIIIFYPAFFLFVYGIGLLLSSIFIFFKDTQYLYNVFLSLLTYMTPIFYKETMLSEFALNLVKINPMYWFIKYFRYCIYMANLQGQSMMEYWRILLGIYAIVLQDLQDVQF